MLLRCVPIIFLKFLIQTSIAHNSTVLPTMETSEVTLKIEPKETTEWQMQETTEPQIIANTTPHVKETSHPQHTTTTTGSVFTVTTEPHKENICPGLAPHSYNHKDQWYCYCIINSSYPYECPYNSPLEVILGDAKITEISGDSFPLWIVNRSQSYGYFQYNTFGTSYRKFVDVDESESVESDDLMTDCLYQMDSFWDLSQCNLENIFGLCHYEADDQDFCDAYHSICEETCSGKSQYKSKFICGENYDESKSCEVCDKKFEMHPKPSVKLNQVHKGKVMVVVTNFKKMVQKNVTLKNGLKMFCYSGAPDPNVHSLWSQYYISEPLTVVRNTAYVYLETNVTGVHWCEIFIYPDMENIKSNELIIPSERHSFVVNATIVYYDNTFIPYETHVELHSAISRSLSNYEATIQLMEMYPLSVINTEATLGFLVLVECTEDIEATYTTLQNTLYNSSVDWNGVTYIIAPNVYCIRSYAIIHDKAVSWPTTKIGESVPTDQLLINESGIPLTRFCTGNFKQGAYWAEIDNATLIDSYSEITEDLYNILTSHFNAEQINDRILELIENDPKVIAFDIYLVGKCLKKVVTSQDQYDTTSTLKIMEAVMNFDQRTLHVAQIELNATDIIINAYDRMLQAMTNNLGRSVFELQIKGSKTIGLVSNLQNTCVTGVAVYKTGEDMEIQTLKNIFEVSEVNKTNLIIATIIPYDLIANISIQTEDISLITGLYLSDTLFNTNATAKTTGTVLSVFIPGYSYVYLEKPVTVIFGNALGDAKTSSCGYWKYGIDDQLVSIRGTWEEDGDFEENSNYKVCYFNHMTHFALIFDAPEDKTLNILTGIMCGISVLAVLCMYLTAACFANWRKEEGTKILLNYSTSILLQDTLLFFFEIVNPSNGIGCAFYAILLHYAILAQFTWMFIISYIQYERLVRVFDTGSSTNKLIRILSIGWASPFIPIIVNLCVDIKMYIQPEYCFIAHTTLYISLFLPIAGVITINIIIFIKIVRSIFQKKDKINGESLLCQKVQVCIMLFLLTGCTWCFALLASILQSLVLGYLFCITSVGQGFFLWVYFILMNKRVRRFWLGKMKSTRNFSSISEKIPSEFQLPRLRSKRGSDINGLIITQGSSTSA